MFLNEGHAKEINEKWSQKFLDSENVIKDCILTSFGMGEYGVVNVQLKLYLYKYIVLILCHSYFFHIWRNKSFSKTYCMRLSQHKLTKFDKEIVVTFDHRDQFSAPDHLDPASHLRF